MGARESLQGNPSPFFVFFFQSKVEKGLLRQLFYLQSQSMDLKNLNGAWKLKRFCITCIKLISTFLSW